MKAKFKVEWQTLSQHGLIQTYFQVVDSVFHKIIPRNADSHEEMINVFENLAGVSTFCNDGSIGLQEAVLTAASGFAWAGYSAAFVGPLLPGVLTGLGLCKAVSVGIKYVSNILPETDAIIKLSLKHAWNRWIRNH